MDDRWQLNGRQMAGGWGADGWWVGVRAVRCATGDRWVDDKWLLDERQIAVGRKTDGRYLDDGCPMVISWMPVE